METNGMDQDPEDYSNTASNLTPENYPAIDSIPSCHDSNNPTESTDLSGSKNYIDYEIPQYENSSENVNGHSDRLIQNFSSTLNYADDAVDSRYAPWISTHSAIDHSSAYHEYNNICVSACPTTSSQQSNAFYTHCFDSDRNENYLANSLLNLSSTTCASSDYDHNAYNHNESVWASSNSGQQYELVEPNHRSGYNLSNTYDESSHDRGNDKANETNNESTNIYVDNSEWMQSTVNEIFTDTRYSTSYSAIDYQNGEKVTVSDEQRNENYIVNEEVSCDSNQSTPVPNSSRSSVQDPQTEVSVANNESSFLFYVPMRVSRNFETGNLCMQYDYPPSKLLSQAVFYPGSSNLNESTTNKRYPPKTVRELLNEQRTKAFNPEFHVNYPNSKSPTFYSYQTNVHQSKKYDILPKYPLQSVNSNFIPHYNFENTSASTSINSNLKNEMPQEHAFHFIENSEQNEAEEINASPCMESGYYSNCSDLNSSADITSDVKNSENWLERSNPIVLTDSEASVISPEQTEREANLISANLPIIPKIESPSQCQPKASVVYLKQDDESNSDWSSIPDFVDGHVNVKEHRPRHFEMLDLQIGNFVVNTINGSKKMVNKFKVLFSKRKFIYEFVPPKCTPFSSGDDHIDLSYIHVPFKTIVALKLEEKFLLILVNTKPQIFGSIKNGSNRISHANMVNGKKEFDVTDGQIGSCPVHKISFKSGQLSKLRDYLIAFDKRFWYLVHRQIPENPVFEQDFMEQTDGVLKICDYDELKTKRKLDKNSASNSKKKVFKISSNSCSCKISCRTMRCSCCKFQLKCSSMCNCKNCDNPLNILSNAGKKLDEIANDDCLMHNIFKHICIESYLYSMIKLDCCKSLVKVLDMIPGQVTCPNGCDVLYQYSWCSLVMHNEAINPRAHCNICMKCIGDKEEHTELCRKSKYLVGVPKGVLTRRRSQALTKAD